MQMIDEAWLDLERSNVHAALETARELDYAITKGEQRVVATATHAFAGMEVRAALTDDDRASAHGLAREPLDTQALRAGVAAVLG
jgi:hypothetical protein